MVRSTGAVRATTTRSTGDSPTPFFAWTKNARKEAASSPITKRGSRYRFSRDPMVPAQLEPGPRPRTSRLFLLHLSPGFPRVSSFPDPRKIRKTESRCDVGRNAFERGVVVDRAGLRNADLRLHLLLRPGLLGLQGGRQRELGGAGQRRSGHRFRLRAGVLQPL